MMIAPENVKLESAIKTVKVARIYLYKRDPESIYQELHDNYFVFDAQNGSWRFDPQATLNNQGVAK